MAVDATTTRGPVWAGVAGVLGVVVPAVGLLVLPIWSFPPTALRGDALVAFTVGHRTALQVVMLLNTAGVSGWLVLAAGVGGVLRTVTPRDSASPTAFTVASAVYVGLLLAGFTAFDVLVHRPPPGGTALALYDLTFGLLAMSGPPTAVAATVYAVVVFRHGGFPRWTVWLAVLVAAGHAVLPLTLVGHGVLGLEGPAITVVPAVLWAWVLATGVVLLRRR